MGLSLAQLKDMFLMPRKPAFPPAATGIRRVQVAPALRSKTGAVVAPALMARALRCKKCGDSNGQLVAVKLPPAAGERRERSEYFHRRCRGGGS